MNQNQTPLTERVTATCMAFLDGLHARPIETEVVVASQWVADIGAVLTPSSSIAKRIHLNKRFKEDVEDEELYRGWNEFEFYGGLITIIVEVKTSRADFLRDIKGKFRRRPRTNFCFLAYPQGLIDIKELPVGWGTIITSKNGKQIYRRPMHPTYYPVHPGETNRFLLELARRVDSRTRGRWTRETMKKWRVEDGDRKRNRGALAVMVNLVRWAKGEKPRLWGGEPLEKWIAWEGVRLNDQMRKQIAEFVEMFPGPKAKKSNG